MDVREKLVELIFKSLCRHIHKSCKLAENIADDLIADGVTVKEWISVNDRLPDCSGKYLVSTNRGNVYQTKFYSYPEKTGGHWGQKDKGKSITHWCCLPQPPKGE